MIIKETIHAIRKEFLNDFLTSKHWEINSSSNELVSAKKILFDKEYTIKIKCVPHMSNSCIDSGIDYNTKFSKQEGFDYIVSLEYPSNADMIIKSMRTELVDLIDKFKNNIYSETKDLLSEYKNKLK